MSLMTDYEYNRNLAKKLSSPKYTNHWEPYMTSNIRGGQMYAMPGLSPAYPMFNTVELNQVNSGSKTKKQVLKGSARKPTLASVENKIISSIENVLKQDNSDMTGGALKINKEKIKKVVTPILRTAASKGLDVGLPALGGVISTYFGANPMIGIVVGNISRQIIKEQTGLGRQSDIGVYKGGGCKAKAKAPAAKKSAAKGPGPKKRQDRNELVKKVMKEKNMNLPSASKYVKEHGLY
jgi:hypothetical protein